MRLSAGMILDNYKLLARAGAGSCGSVWQAENIVSGELEALKILSGNELAERELRALKLYREIQHPALIHIRHVGRFGENVFYTMEWCESSLAERKVDAEELLTIAKQLASGLAQLHSCGLLHRDIKPANIFFHQGSPVLGDIGLLTRQEGATFAGSPGFLSPDILSGKCSADCYSDCYALAKSIYCALSGFGPEQFPLYTGVMTPESSLLMRAIMAVCSPNPSLRTAEEFLNFLTAPPRKKKNKSVWLRGILLLSVVIALGAAALWFGKKKTQEQPTAEEKRIISENAPEETRIIPEKTQEQPAAEEIRIIPEKTQEHPAAEETRIIPEKTQEHPAVEKKRIIPEKKSEPAPLQKKENRSPSREEIEKAFTALPPAAEEKLRRLRLSKDAADRLSCPGQSRINPAKEKIFLESLSPEQRERYQRIIAEISVMQSTRKWQKIKQAWSMRYFEYQAKLRKMESEKNTDAMSALRELAAQDPLLAFQMKQSECILAQKNLLEQKKQPDISAMETFASAAGEYGRAFYSLPQKVYQ